MRLFCGYKDVSLMFYYFYSALRPMYFCLNNGLPMVLPYSIQLSCIPF